MTRAKSTKSKSVDFATVAFYDQLPSHVRLDEISLKVEGVRADPTMISGFYGYQNKLNGLQAARAYAEEHDKSMLVVDVSITMENILKPGVSDFDALQGAEFVNLARLTRGVIDELAFRWKEWIREDAKSRGKSFNEGEVNWSYPDQFVSRYPKYVENVFEIWPSLKTVVYPAHPDFIPKDAAPLYLGAIRLDRCKGAITAAARLNPEVEIEMP